MGCTRFVQRNLRPDIPINEARDDERELVIDEIVAWLRTGCADVVGTEGLWVAPRLADAIERGDYRKKP